MKGLKCTTKNCEHNTLCHCTAGIINVTENGVCASKMKRSGGILSQSFSDLEASRETNTVVDEIEILVQCDAKCRFNDNFKCTRENVLIEDGLVKTKCYSRQK